MAVAVGITLSVTPASHMEVSWRILAECMVNPAESGAVTDHYLWPGEGAYRALLLHTRDIPADGTTDTGSSVTLCAHPMPTAIRSTEWAVVGD